MSDNQDSSQGKPYQEEELQDNMKSTEPVGEPEVIEPTDPAGEPDVTVQAEPVSEPDVTVQTEPVSEPDVIVETEPAGEPDVTVQAEPAGEPDVIVETEPAGEPDEEKPESDISDIPLPEFSEADYENGSNPENASRRGLIREMPEQSQYKMTEDLPDAPSNAVIRRVRTGPVDVIPPVPKDKGFLYSLLDTVRFISLGLVIGILLVVFVVQRNDVYGPSMLPTLHENDAVFVEMVSKYFTTPKRGEIVTVDAAGMPGYTEKEKIIKRVIGEPGETVAIRDGFVFINGVLLDEPYLADNVPTNVNENGVASGYDNITLGEKEYFVMGDNRGASLDSRVLGPIPFSRIKAHVIARIYPFDDIGLL